MPVQISVKLLWDNVYCLKHCINYFNKNFVKSVSLKQEMCLLGMRCGGFLDVTDVLYSVGVDLQEIS